MLICRTVLFWLSYSALVNIATSHPVAVVHTGVTEDVNEMESIAAGDVGA